MDRLNRRLTFLAALVAALVATLALAPAISATAPGRNGLLAFQAEVGDAGPQLFTLRSNGKGLRQITHVDGIAFGPDWSPDGRRIAFTHNDCAIALVDPDGDNLQVIASEPEVCLGDPSYTPDGRRLVYTRFDFVLEVETIWSMRVDGTDRRFITDAGGPDPNVSPDGRKLSFKGGPDGALFVANIDGSGVRQVSPSVSVSYKHDWSPDGRHIVVSDDSDPGPDEAANIVIVDPAGSGWRYLTHYGPGYRAYVGGYSPDGKWIVFRLEGNGIVPILYRIRPDGSGLHRLYSSSTTIPRGIDWGTRPGR